MAPPLIGYYIRRMERGDGMPAKFTEKLLERFFQRDLPTAAEQADNFVLWLGDRTQPGESLTIKAQEIYAEIGAYLASGVG